MANHASALKRHRQSEKRRVRNAAVKSNLRSLIKKARETVATAKPEEVKTQLARAAAHLDKAVTGGVLHRNNASRKISRLTRAANAARK
ncbi:MAG: 30S ribosomal protein S20 [Deltaproteobacteria bacterium]|nr:30S ribosomal protein S20 [Deltaproteobacteria bacterium]